MSYEFYDLDCSFCPPTFLHGRQKKSDTGDFIFEEIESVHVVERVSFTMPVWSRLWHRFFYPATSLASSRQS